VIEGHKEGGVEERSEGGKRWEGKGPRGGSWRGTDGEEGESVYEGETE